MRTETLLVMGFLAAGVLAITFWPANSAIPFDPSPPGQYPLGQSRFEWPASQKTKSYRPADAMGTDVVKFGSMDTKTICATSKTCPA
jgi:hypothetical protein